MLKFTKLILLYTISILITSNSKCAILYADKKQGVLIKKTYKNIYERGNHNTCSEIDYCIMQKIMKITILTVGKIKEKFYTDAIAEYSKRLSRYCRLEIVQVADEKTTENSTDTEIEIVKKKEAERLMVKIPDDAYVITLEINGKQLDSVELSDKINKLGISGTSHIIFVIGGSLGLHKSVSDRANYKLSFSKMTFPHQLMRVILLEQIYRSYRIINHEPYHK